VVFDGHDEVVAPHRHHRPITKLQIYSKWRDFDKRSTPTRRARHMESRCGLSYSCVLRVILNHSKVLPGGREIILDLWCFKLIISLNQTIYTLVRFKCKKRFEEFALSNVKIKHASSN